MSSEVALGGPRALCMGGNVLENMFFHFGNKRVVGKCPDFVFFPSVLNHRLRDPLRNCVSFQKKTT